MAEAAEKPIKGMEVDINWLPGKDQGGMEVTFFREGKPQYKLRTADTLSLNNKRLDRITMGIGIGVDQTPFKKNYKPVEMTLDNDDQVIFNVHGFVPGQGILDHITAHPFNLNPKVTPEADGTEERYHFTNNPNITHLIIHRTSLPIQQKALSVWK